MSKRKIPEIEERLAHIVKAIDEILEFTKDMDFQAFEADRKTRLAVEKLYEIIGEAAYKIPKTFKSGYPQVEWEEMEATRHILVHNYYEVIPRILWDVKEVYLLDLKKKLTEIQEHLK